MQENTDPISVAAAEPMQVVHDRIVGPFIVVVSKRSDEKEIAYEFRRKGFLVGAIIKTKDGCSFLLSLSPKLVLKLALELNLSLKTFGEYTNLEKLRIASAAILVINRAKSIQAEDVWISHDKNMLKEIDSTSGDIHLAHVKDYYGSKIAMYFGWLAFFTKVLAIPSIAGLLLFCHQIYLQDVDSIWVPFFCVLISLWSTYFLEFWKRRGNELSYGWKVFAVEDADTEQDLAKSARRSDEGVPVRQLLSFVTVLSLMYVMIRVMLYFKNMQLNAAAIYGEESYYKYYPTVLYSVLPAVATVVFEPIAHALNKFEEHTTKTDAENSMIFKHFALEFVNRYCALFHAAFWLNDLDVLRSLLISLLTINAVLNNAVEIGTPMLKSAYNRWSNRVKARKERLKRAKDKALGQSEPSALLVNGKPTLHIDITATAAVPSDQSTFPPTDQRCKLKEILEEEVAKTDYDLNADYLEIVIQYGYVTMFVVAFPLAPALALLNNIFESRVDLFKLTECRRPALQQRSNIGSWQYCMEFISFLAVITNCYLIVMVSTHFEMIVPGELEPYVRSESGRLIAMMLIEHILLGFKIVMMYVIDDVPRWIREAVAAQNSAEREALAKARLQKYVTSAGDHRRSARSPRAAASSRGFPSSDSFMVVPSPRSQKDDDSICSSMDGSSQHTAIRSIFSRLSGKTHAKSQSQKSTASAPAAIHTDLPVVAEHSDDEDSGKGEQRPRRHTLQRNFSTHSGSDFVESPGGYLDTPQVATGTHVSGGLTPADRLVKEATSPYGFDPAHMMLLICLPAVLNYFQITPWLYLPAAVLFFGYLQAKKDRIDRKIAMGIVSDPTLLKLVLEEMPSWPTDSEFQQMEWTNFMMQKFWPMLAIVGEEKAVRIGQRILTRMKPSFLSELAIKRFSFGTIPPRFLGIRMHHTKDEEGVVRCDLEMRYAGDPQIIIQVGPTEVEILNLRISCMLRCEMLDFCPKMTPFKLASATMMKKPFVDFNIKVAGMDIMSTKAMTNLVHNLFHKALQNAAMYPKKIFVPMGSSDESLDLEKLNMLTPVGILYLTLERGVDLIQANVFGSSDPYVDIETIDQEMQSEILYKTTNPVWNETYDIVVYDRGSQVISFTVSDFDVTQNHKCLGKAEFEVNKVPYNTRVQKTLQLKGVDQGSIVVSCVYIPMAAAKAGDKKCTLTQMPKSVFKREHTGDDDEDEGEKDVLFDLPIEELHSDEVLISGDLALQSPAEELDTHTLAQAGLGILTISKIRIRNLKVGASASWKPCVSFHVGTAKKQTRSKKNMVNPEFDEHFAFVVKDQTMAERILVKVLDKKKIMTASRQVGEATVSLYDLLNLKSCIGPQGSVIEKEYEVESEVVDCVVGFKMQWFSTAAHMR